MIAKGSFTSSEQDQIFSMPSTFVLVRTGFFLEKVDAWRQTGDENSNTLFIFPIYLQHLSLDVNDCIFNITGHISLSTDPLGLYIKNIVFDTYRASSGFEQYISCNYPEANITNEAKIENATLMMTKERTSGESPLLFGSTGPENITITNYDFRDHYTVVTKLDATVANFILGN